MFIHYIVDLLLKMCFKIMIIHATSNTPVYFSVKKAMY
jgi:hypothetical protein